MPLQYAAPIRRAPSMFAPTQFNLLNHLHELPQRGGWDDPSLSKLRRYNLHYFDDLNAADSECREQWHSDILQRWIAENAPTKGTGWEPYPTSLRIVNWVKWAARGATLGAVADASLAVQARWLSKRLETHLLGNHLFANAKALVYAGLYFDGAEAESWYRRGSTIVTRELHEQVLADGGHFELSPMYHALFLEDLFDLINVLQAYGRRPPAEWTGAPDAMQAWIESMTHPDGHIAFFNDAACGVSPRATELRDYAARLGLALRPSRANAVTVLERSGYIALRSAEAYLVCDCAAVGPGYLPAHAHADTLSFELSLGTRRIIVNSGTSEYGDSPERLRQRGTAAHNTVVLGGADSSEVWSGFRVGRRARAWFRVESLLAPYVLEGCHDGYSRPTRKCLHFRRWILSEHSLLIEDRIVGAVRIATSFLHLHPDVHATPSGVHELSLSLLNGGSTHVEFRGADNVELQTGTWHPCFGATLACQVIAVTFSGTSLTTRMTWAEAPCAC